MLKNKLINIMLLLFVTSFTPNIVNAELKMGIVNLDLLFKEIPIYRESQEKVKKQFGGFSLCLYSRNLLLFHQFDFSFRWPFQGIFNFSGNGTIRFLAYWTMRFSANGTMRFWLLVIILDTLLRIKFKSHLLLFLD